MGVNMTVCDEIISVLSAPFIHCKENKTTFRKVRLEQKLDEERLTRTCSSTA